MVGFPRPLAQEPRQSANSGSSVKVWDLSPSGGQEWLTIPSIHIYSNFSEDGKYLMGPSDNGKLLKELEGHSYLVGPVKFSFDGKLILSGSAEAKVWDARTYKNLMTLKANFSGLQDVAFSKDGKYLATADGDGTVKVWDAVTGQELLNFPSTARGNIIFSANSKHLIAGDYDVFHPLGVVQGYSIDINEAMAIAKSRLIRSWTPEECQQFLHTDTCPPAP